MIALVADIIKVLESYAPLHLAEPWDNVGLQVGQRDWPVKLIWVALDPVFDVVAQAAEHGVNMLVTHHPLIFKPLKTVDFSTPLGRVIYTAGQHQMAIYSSHTNLDSAVGGMNDAMARRLGVLDLHALSPDKKEKKFKLVIFTSADHRQRVLNTLFETGVGIHEIYSTSGIEKSIKQKRGFRFGTQPNIEKQMTGGSKFEIRIEAEVIEKDLKTVLNHIQRHLQDIEINYDVYPLKLVGSGPGLGRIGRLQAPIALDVLAREIKKTLGIDAVRIAGDPRLMVEIVAVCTGSGSGLMDLFLNSDADVFLSGDLRYHDAQNVLAAGKGLIDIGHFASEHIVVNDLTKRLQKDLINYGFDITVKGCRLEKEPFLSL